MTTSRSSGSGERYTPGWRPSRESTAARLAVYESGALEAIVALGAVLDTVRNLDAPSDIEALLLRGERLAGEARDNLRRARVALLSARVTR